MQTDSVKTVRSTCGGCHNMCPLLIDVQDNTIVRTHGVPGEPRTSGALCSKGQAGPQIAHDPRRLLYPMRRVGERGKGQFERISWDEAIKELAGKISQASEDHGPTSVAFFRGQACGWGFSYGMLQRLAHCIGTEPGCGASECFVPRAVAEAITYGGMAHPYGYNKVELIIFWGKQPAFSYAPSLRKIYDAQERGAKRARPAWDGPETVIELFGVSLGVGVSIGAFLHALVMHIAAAFVVCIVVDNHGAFAASYAVGMVALVLSPVCCALSHSMRFNRMAKTLTNDNRPNIRLSLEKYQECMPRVHVSLALQLVALALVVVGFIFLIELTLSVWLVVVVLEVVAYFLIRTVFYEFPVQIRHVPWLRH